MEASESHCSNTEGVTFHVVFVVLKTRAPAPLVTPHKPFPSVPALCAGQAVRPGLFLPPVGLHFLAGKQSRRHLL